MKDKYENALKGDTDQFKNNKLGELNELAYKDLIFSININLTFRKVSFVLAWNAKSMEFPKRNYK